MRFSVFMRKFFPYNCPSNLKPSAGEMGGRLLAFLKNFFQEKMSKNNRFFLMTKGRAGSFQLSSLAKILMGFFLAQGPAFAEEKSPSFIFNEEEGLQALPIEEQKASQNQKKGSQSGAISSSKTVAPATSAIPRLSSKNPLPANIPGANQSSEEQAEAERQNESSTMPALSSSPQPKNPLQTEPESAKTNEDPSQSPSSPLEEKVKLDTPPPDNSLSENFAPPAKEPIKGASFLDTLSEDVSWFFEKRNTKYKIAVTPDGGYDTTKGLHLGLRFFSYSSDKKGYYFALSGSKYISGSFSKFNLLYISPRENSFRTEGSLIYDNHYENYFGEGMSASLSDLKKLYAHRFVGNYKILYQAPQQAFYTGLGAKLIFRKEIPNETGKTQFNTELFLFLKALIGYDDRDNWKNPKTGNFHRLAFACKAIFDYHLGHCKGEGDFRTYISPFKETNYHFNLKNAVLALRAFAGYSLLSPSSYSIAYILSGESLFQDLKTLRGFKQNRFRGDKIYFFQAETRFPIWNKYLGGVLFAEMGEAAKYRENFEGFVVDYGGGIRVGLPPNYDMKLRLDFGIGRDRQNELNYDVQLSFLHAF